MLVSTPTGADSMDVQRFSHFLDELVSWSADNRTTSTPRTSDGSVNCRRRASLLSRVATRLAEEAERTDEHDFAPLAEADDEDDDNDLVDADSVKF